MDNFVEYKSEYICGEKINKFKNELVPYFNNLYIALVNKLGILKYVKKIIITDNFVEEVVSIQQELGYNPNVTNSKFGRAFGKVIKNSNENNFYIVLDSSIASYIVDDYLFEPIINELADGKLKESIINKRKMALNIFYHELSHIEMDSTYEYEIGEENTVCNFLTNISYRLFQEYYATRRALEYYGSFSINSDSKFNEVENIEKEIVDLKKKYKYREITLNDFVINFHELFTLSLIYVISYYANFYGQKHDFDRYETLNIENHVSDITTALDKLYNDFFENNGIVFSNLNDVVLRYLESFNLFLTDTENGVYWSIPW